MNPEFAARYAELARWHWWFRGRERILEEVLRRALPPTSGREIVAVGAGPPEQLRWLTPFIGSNGHVLGLDIDRIHAHDPPPGVRYVVGDVETAPLRTRSVDVVLALDVLEHLDDDAAGLREVARMLTPDGLLVATVPAFQSLWGPHDVMNNHRRRYTRKTLRRAFLQAALPPPRITYFNVIFFPLVAALRWSRRLTGTTWNDIDVNGPGALNDAVAAVYGLERYVVPHAYIPVGVSLLAVVRVPGAGR